MSMEGTVLAHGSNHSCGVSILVKDSLEFDLKSTLVDDNGRYILLKATVQGCSYILANIYAPNKVREQCSFFVELQEKLDVFIGVDEYDRMIIGGDFNVVKDPDLDCSGGAPKQKESNKFLNSICLNYDLVDIWRMRNPGSKLFTWKHMEVEEANIKTAVRTDHSAITISFNSLHEQTRGPSYWKFNSSLVNDENYVLVVNQKLPEWLQEFKEVEDKRVLWDLIKYRMRQFTLRYSKENARKRKQ